MKSIYKIGSLILVSLLLTTSCNEFVDVDPPAQVDKEDYFQAPEDYDQALIGAYDLLQTSYLINWIGEIASDNSIAGGESVNDTKGLHDIDQMLHNASTQELKTLFRYLYAGVARCNYIFENKDNIEFEGKEDILAQAKFLRGYYYFQLVKFFGGVPLLVDLTVDRSEVANYDRATAEEVYAQVEMDLIEASEILPLTPAEKGRVTKGAALALLGKVYLYQDKFDLAASTLDQVIELGQYSLFDDYSTMFLLENEGNNEVVFDIQYIGTEGGSYECLVCLEGNAAVGFQGIRNYNGPYYSDGNGYNLPTQNLVDEFEDGDPRLGASVLDIDEFIAAQPNADEITYGVGAGGHTGYYNNKYIKRTEELGAADNDLTSPLNFQVIRYADVLLMAAEAYNRKSAPNDGTARDYLNQVRARVNMPNVNLSGNALTEAIYHERRVEFSGEGLRFFDLVRTGKAAQSIEGFQVNKNELFPIPQAEINTSGAGWAQNDGY